MIKTDTNVDTTIKVSDNGSWISATFGRNQGFKNMAYSTGGAVDPLLSRLIEAVWDEAWNQAHEANRT